MAKGPEAFRTISEAAEEVDVPQHVLRFWETRFTFIKPMKRAGGRRFYRPQDIAVLKGVRRLLHDEGFTIKGVQRLHREEGMRRLLATGEGTAAEPAAVATHAEPVSAPATPSQGGGHERLNAALADLLAAQAKLDALLKS